MRVGWKDLFVWSFLMVSGHGAGLMLVPVLMAQPMHGMSHPMTGATPIPSMALGMSTIALAVLVHTISLLVVAGALALLVFETYESSGLGPLTNRWVNFDLVWAIALLLTGCATLLM